MKEPEQMAKEIASNLTKLQKKMAKDPTLKKRLKASPDILGEMGFSPEQISSFKLEKAKRDSCECSCAPNKGFGKGCFIPTGDGAVTDP